MVLNYNSTSKLGKPFWGRQCLQYFLPGKIKNGFGYSTFVRSPLTRWLFNSLMVKLLYCSISPFVISLKLKKSFRTFGSFQKCLPYFASEPASHQSTRFPPPLKFLPEVSKPWVISCPIIAPRPEGCILGELWAVFWKVSPLKNCPRNKHCIILRIVVSFNHSRGAPNGVTFPTHLVNWSPEFFELSYFLKEPGFLMVFEMLVWFYIKAFIKVFKLRFVKKLRRISDVADHQGYLFPGQLHWIYQLSFLSSLQGFCLCLLIHPG